MNSHPTEGNGSSGMTVRSSKCAADSKEAFSFCFWHRNLLYGGAFDEEERRLSEGYVHDPIIQLCRGDELFGLRLRLVEDVGHTCANVHDHDEISTLRGIGWETDKREERCCQATNASPPSCLLRRLRHQIIRFLARKRNATLTIA